MVKKQPAAADTKTTDPSKPKAKEAEKPSKSTAVDRPGFDLGGATSKTRAGTGLGLGDDAFDSPAGRSLPGRRGKSE